MELLSSSILNQKSLPVAIPRSANVRTAAEILLKPIIKKRGIEAPNSSRASESEPNSPNTYHDYVSDTLELKLQTASDDLMLAIKKYVKLCVLIEVNKIQKNV